MIDHVFRILEAQRSTRALIDKVLEGTGVELSTQVFDKAIYYLEIRHLIVHNSSLIDLKFEKHYGEEFKYAKAGNKLPMSQGLAKKALLAVEKLCSAVDISLMDGGYLTPSAGAMSAKAEPLEM